MKVRCNKCGIEFNAYLSEREKHTRIGTVIRTYMECPRCGEQYDVCYDTNETFALKKKERKLLSKGLSDAESSREVYRRGQKITKTKRQIEEKMEQAKLEYYREKEKEENG